MATHVDFPFAVEGDRATGGTRLVNARFRFTVRTARELERASGVGITLLVARGQSVEAMVLLACYGLRWQHKRLTEDETVDLVDKFLDAGGDCKALSGALYKALNESGVYGEPLPPEPVNVAVEGEGSENPIGGTPTRSSSTS